MKFLRTIAMIVVVAALAVTYVAVGFAVCLLPSVTRGLANAYVKVDMSPFSCEQLVRVADATRDFSFGAHDETALYRTIFEIDAEYLKSTDGAAARERGFPNVAIVKDPNDLEQLRLSCDDASERYCFSRDTVSHLEDCNVILRQAQPVLIGCAVVGAAGLLYIGMKCDRKSAGLLLLASGGAVLTVFALLGICAAINFDGFFTAFHEVFFSQGNWMFSADSLLICSLPTEFWMGMGVCWLVSSVVASTASASVGHRIRKS